MYTALIWDWDKNSALQCTGESGLEEIHFWYIWLISKGKYCLSWDCMEYSSHCKWLALFPRCLSVIYFPKLIALTECTFQRPWLDSPPPSLLCLFLIVWKSYLHAVKGVAYWREGQNSVSHKVSIWTLILFGRIYSSSWAMCSHYTEIEEVVHISDLKKLKWKSIRLHWDISGMLSDWLSFTCSVQRKISW